MCMTTLIFIGFVSVSSHYRGHAFCSSLNNLKGLYWYALKEKKDCLRKVSLTEKTKNSLNLFLKRKNQQNTTGFAVQPAVLAQHILCQPLYARTKRYLPHLSLRETQSCRSDCGLSPADRPCCRQRDPPRAAAAPSTCEPGTCRGDIPAAVRSQ